MIVTLEEAKQYLRQDADDEDALILSLMESSQRMVMEIGRLSEDGLIQHETLTRIAILYAVAYLYEHREDANHHALTLDLRSILAPIREGAF